MGTNIRFSYIINANKCFVKPFLKIFSFRICPYFNGVMILCETNTLMKCPPDIQPAALIHFVGHSIEIVKLIRP